jgi:hypothetical protein
MNSDLRTTWQDRPVYKWEVQWWTTETSQSESTTKGSPSSELRRSSETWMKREARCTSADYLSTYKPFRRVPARASVSWSGHTKRGVIQLARRNVGARRGACTRSLRRVVAPSRTYQDHDALPALLLADSHARGRRILPREDPRIAYVFERDLRGEGPTCASSFSGHAAVSYLALPISRLKKKKILAISRYICSSSFLSPSFRFFASIYLSLHSTTVSQNTSHTSIIILSKTNILIRKNINLCEIGVSQRGRKENRTRRLKYEDIPDRNVTLTAAGTGSFWNVLGPSRAHEKSFFFFPGIIGVTWLID